MDGFKYALFSTPANKKIITEFQNRNQNFLLIPSIETKKIELTEQEKSVLSNPEKFDWIVFTDIFAADYFIEFLQEINFDLYDLDEVRICAFGEAVADKLRFSAIHTDIIAVTTNTDKIFKSIVDYLNTDGLSNLKFLILKDISAQFELTNRLKQCNSNVSEISLYQTVEKDKTEISKIKALLLGGAIDQIVFSDPADLVGFKRYFLDSNNSNDFSGIKFSAINEVMFQMLYENGFHPIFFSPN